jgi:hypothetical protein
MSDPVDRRPDQDRPEPEIIPPGAPLPRRPHLRVSAETGGTHYVYTTRVGPVGLGLMALAGGAIGVLALLFLLSAAVVGFVAIGALLLAGLIAGLLRGPPRPLR